MPDPATSTVYPAELDIRPAIQANNRQDHPDLAHDRQHDVANALLNAIQLLLGTLADDDNAPSVLGRLLALEAGIASVARRAVVENISAQDHTLAASSAGHYLRTTYEGAATLTVPPQSEVPWEADKEIHLRAAGGAVTLVPGDGVALLPPGGGSLVVPERGALTLKRAAADVWDVLGQTEAES